MYQEVLVGYCDYSAGNNLFLFGQSKNKVNKKADKIIFVVFLSSFYEKTKAFTNRKENCKIMTFRSSKSNGRAKK